MRHKKKGRKLKRGKSQKKALLKSLAESLILHEKIKTTHARSQELCSYIERLLTFAKKNDLSGKRYVARHLNQKATKKLDEIAKRHIDRKGGYTRIIKLGFRTHDGADVSLIEFVEKNESITKNTTK